MRTRFAYGVFCLLAATPTAAATVSYQAESARLSGAVVESAHAGYSGTGYVNLNNRPGTYVEWTVNAPSSATMTLVFRFANGTALERPMEIRVNGTIAHGALRFPANGAWRAWGTRSVIAPLQAGANIVRATSLSADGGPNLDRLNVDDTPVVDWGKAMVESTLTRMPTASALGVWQYTRGLYLWGQYLVWQRLREPRYLQYMKDWADLHVSDTGQIDHGLSALDYMLSGVVLLALDKETGLEKYRLGADTIRNRLNTYPRTSDGGFWHATSRRSQLWADGTYMVLPFLGRYGVQYGQQAYTADETANQLVIYANHLRDASTGLPFHAYDESGAQTWAIPPENRSAIFWCRAIGWYGMAIVEVLETLPATHPQRPTIVANLQALVAALAERQDPATGMWFQVINRETLPTNWVETSCSCMHTYTISKAVQRGYVAKPLRRQCAARLERDPREQDVDRIRRAHEHSRRRHRHERERQRELLPPPRARDQRPPRPGGVLDHAGAHDPRRRPAVAEPDADAGPHGDSDAARHADHTRAAQSRGLIGTSHPTAASTRQSGAPALSENPL